MVRKPDVAALAQECVDRASAACAFDVKYWYEYVLLGTTSRSTASKHSRCVAELRSSRMDAPPMTIAPSSPPVPQARTAI